MRYVTYDDDGQGWRGGALDGERVVDLGEALGSDRPGDAVPLALSMGMSAVERAIAAAPSRPLAGARLGPPIPRPEKIVCIGLNYRDHAAEAGLPLPTVPMLFAKYANSLIGPEDAIVLPRGEHDVDYEAEVAIVVAERCKDVAPGSGLDRVGGLMCFNDVTARDLQFETSQWTGGKAIDSFGPCGPAVVTLDELGDVQDLSIRTRVNGEPVQESSTADMVFGFGELVERLSRVMTLAPGDVIATGTPAGVGFARSPQVLLRPGDLVEVEVDGLGALRNPVIAESQRPGAVSPALRHARSGTR